MFRSERSPQVLWMLGLAIVVWMLATDVGHADIGWPNQAGEFVFSSPAVTDLDGDGKAEVIIASVSKGLYVWNYKGEQVSGWPRATTHEFHSSVAVGNLDGDGQMEIVACSHDQITGGVTANYVFAFNHDGTQLSGFPKAVTDARILSTPAIGDIDTSVSGNEIVVLAGDKKLYAWHKNGTAVSGYPHDLGGLEEDRGNVVIMSSPALADTDGDAALETFVGSNGENFYYFHGVSSSTSASTPFWILSSPSVADIDGDDKYEVVFGCGDERVYCYEIDSSTLTLESGWPKRTHGLVYSSPALADVDGNDSGALEIVCGSYDSQVYVWNHDGTTVSGWPQKTRKYVLGSPAVDDVDGDGNAEVIVGSSGNKVYIWNHDGTLLPGWPRTLQTDIFSSPAISDMDNDGKKEITIADFKGVVYVWELSYDTSGSSFSGAWPMFGYDSTRKSWIEIEE